MKTSDFIFLKTCCDADKSLHSQQVFGTATRSKAHL